MSTATKICTACGKEKPRTEFCSAGNGKLTSRCKDCDAERKRAEYKGNNGAKINRNRARHRAIAALIERHADEFEALYEQHLVEAAEEAEALATEKSAQEHYRDEPVRLRPGKRRSGQKAGDRIDVARCPHCIRHHDRGHVCAKCGAAPDVTRMRTADDGVVDEVTVERAMRGERLPLSKPERDEAVRRLSARGVSAHDVARLLHMSYARACELRAVLGCGEAAS